MKVHPTGVVMRPDSARVLIRPFIPSNPEKVQGIIDRVLSLDEEQTRSQLAIAMSDFSDRHTDIEALWLSNFEKVNNGFSFDEPLSETRKLLLGAFFSGEYALESAALFNPSMVRHPDQSGLAEGELRFIISLRATGEGHISSIEFRSGVIGADYSISIDQTSRFVTAPDLDPNLTYLKPIFVHKLREMGFENEFSEIIMGSLGHFFSGAELNEAIAKAATGLEETPRDVGRTMECVRWLAESNYQIHFRRTMALSERIIFPISPSESNGIEDARFVRFVNEDETVVYYATYTAFNGRAILPQLLETEDFQHFRVVTLNGSAVQNKGMALFPRRINGCYAMISRQDDENLFLMFSDNPHFWSDPQLLRQPTQPWELVKIGNCGSPIETEEGWLLLTHGVGPMRKYCIGAILLDLDDPSKVIGQLKKPLLAPEGTEREGYVPNVVYSCGALIHGERLILPYGISDSASGIVTVEMKELFAALKNGD